MGVRLVVWRLRRNGQRHHAKNFAFIYDEQWRFAPAFDLLPCGSSGDYRMTSVNDNPLPERADVLRVAERVGLDPKQAANIFEQIQSLCL